MTGHSPVHDFMLPRLAALLDEAVASGIPRDVAVAVLIDLVTSPRFDTAVPDPRDDAPAGPASERGADSIVLVHGMSPEQPRGIGENDPADFIRPQGWGISEP